MPRYFFDVLEVDGTVVRDVVAVDLNGPDEALDAASDTVMSVLADEAPRHPQFMVQVVVRDESGEEIGRRDGGLIQSDKLSRGIEPTANASQSAQSLQSAPP